MNTEVEHLKREVIPKLFQDSSLIGTYGRDEQSTLVINGHSDLLEHSPVAQLTEKLSQIMAKLSDADPKAVNDKPNWVQRFTGKAVEAKARYQHARKTLENLLADAQEISKNVGRMVSKIDEMLVSSSAEEARLRTLLQAGREYLEENPRAGIPAEQEISFDKPRERFARKLTNLATLQASNELSNNQLRLARAVAIDMLDRHGETVGTLFPVWRQHTLALITSKNLQPETMAAATKAHDALKQSLAVSLMNQNG